MTEARENELLAHVPTLATLDEAHNFRACITETEQMGTRLMRALTDRIDYLARKEGRL